MKGQIFTETPERKRQLDELSLNVCVGGGNIRMYLNEAALYVGPDQFNIE
jgi:hypothetical protein